ncbi:MAG: hypothetical protein H7A23_25990 [Leptospiraceae bacterium]|nr:hypothetical protein [Leptospiraceae bacterium]MCP5498021.1 hypothetical protein [Leptospiraceae bacterium]
MTAIQLQKIAIEKINNIYDEDFLNALLQILENSQNVFKLNQYQLYQIQESQKQIKNGKFISNEDLEEEENEWLNE